MSLSKDYYLYPLCILCVIHIIVLVFFSIYILKITNYELQFLSSNDTINILLNDRDQYYKTFNEIDFKVRNVSDTKSYKNKIKTSAANFTLQEKMKINACIIQIHSQHFFKRRVDDQFKNMKIIDKILDLPWKFGLIKDTKYENGLPHTRLDTIIISKNHLSTLPISKLKSLLVHEKVHTFQKLFPRITNKFIENLGFKQVHLKSSFNLKNKSRIRANPDINEYVYKDDKNRLMLATYTENAETISDIEYNFESQHKQASEHPYEKMAIDISNLF